MIHVLSTVNKGVGTELKVTFIEAASLQPVAVSVITTVYVVGVVGVAIGFATVELLNPAVGVQL